MNIGVDGRVITWHVGSGLSTYTTNLLSNIQKLLAASGLYIFYPDKNITDIFEMKQIPKSLLIGERRKDFWQNVYHLDWRLDYPVQIFHNTVNGIGLPKAYNGKTVITLHDLIPYILPETVDRAHLDFTLKYTPYIIEKVSHIITVSNYSKADIIRYFGISEDKITVTHLAADAIYQPMDRTKSRNIIFHKYGVDKKYILYLGGFSLRKNIARLLNAFKKVTLEHEPDLNLLILGEHSRSYDSLWDLTKQLDLCEYVKFLDFIPTEDLPFFYNGAEVFVYPSLYEGFGLPPLEAMQCGTPVVTSNVSSIPEIVGDACLLVNPYSVDEIAESVLKLINDDNLWHKYSLLGMEKAKTYSWLSTAEKTVQVYENCLKGSKAF